MTENNPGHSLGESIDIGGVALPRKELADVLPDIERFEARLADALAVDSHMKNGDGGLPDYARNWPEQRIVGVIATLKELGSLREQVGQQADAIKKQSDRTQT